MSILITFVAYTTHKTFIIGRLVLLYDSSYWNFGHVLPEDFVSYPISYNRECLIIG